MPLINAVLKRSNKTVNEIENLKITFSHDQLLSLNQWIDEYGKE